ncbi:MAG: hypothetical protein WA097_01295 [Candidatus Hydromicrobium sp.]
MLFGKKLGYNTNYSFGWYKGAATGLVHLGCRMTRIVRMGSHTGQDQLCSRLNQHFINENKDRSIFRKNIGKCLLNMRDDPYLEIWELDLTTRDSKNKFNHLIKYDYQKSIERNN